MLETKDPFDHILPHIISIGSSLGEELKAPEGSGILVKFILMIKGITHQVYGILSASHVVEEIDLIHSFKFNADCVGLIKPAGRTGETYNETYPIKFVYISIDKIHLRRLMQNHKIEGNHKNERDIAFICLGIDAPIVQSELIKNSQFFDLDTNPILVLPKKHHYPFIFFKGACLDELVNTQDRVLATELIIENGGIQKQYPKSGIIYHEIPNTTGRSMKGASGAGIWMFNKNSNNEVVKILKGVIVEGGNKASDAIDISYIRQTFIPDLETFINTLNLDIKR